jgi:hypothetical protein
MERPSLKRFVQRRPMLSIQRISATAQKPALLIAEIPRVSLSPISRRSEYSGDSVSGQEQ